MLYVGLPPEAAIWRVDGQQWTLAEELLAVIAERTDQWGLFHAYLQTDRKGRSHLPDKPLEVPRPGDARPDESTETVVTDVRVIQRFFST